jgi:hypothetical protein
MARLRTNKGANNLGGLGDAVTRGFAAYLSSAA